MVAAKRAARRDSVRVFKQFLWLEAGSVRTALSRPAHQRVTQTVRLPRRIQHNIGVQKWVFLVQF